MYKRQVRIFEAIIIACEKVTAACLQITSTLVLLAHLLEVNGLFNSTSLITVVLPHCGVGVCLDKLKLTQEGFHLWQIERLSFRQLLIIVIFML